MNYKDITLTPEDMQEIEDKITLYEQDVYGKEMPLQAKGILRSQLIKETKDGIWSNRDYVYGQDEGEVNKGDIPNAI